MGVSRNEEYQPTEGYAFGTPHGHVPPPLELVGLKFSWSPTRLYRRVERVGTTGEPLRLEARESQILFLNPLFPTRQNVGAQCIAPRRPPVFPTHFFSLRFFEIY